MATLYVRDVPAEVYEELRKRAAEEGRSMSQEALRLLR
jgi:plasmid stability protein